jgi:hypothetical protein
MNRIIGITLTALAVAGLHYVQPAVAKSKPRCLGLYLPGAAPPNCRLDLPIAPMAVYGATLNLHQVNKQMKFGGVSPSDRGALLKQIRGVNNQRIYDWAKAAKHNRRISALVPCFVGAVFGTLLAAVTAIIEEDIKPAVFAAGAIGGCIADMACPSTTGATDERRRGSVRGDRRR